MKICPKDKTHDSTDVDYCSVCGAKIQGGPSPPGSKVAGARPQSPPLSTAGAGDVCPDCGAPRAAGGARFCEICRYDFQMGAAEVSSTPEARPLPPAPAAKPAASGVTGPSPPERVAVVGDIAPGSGAPQNAGTTGSSGPLHGLAVSGTSAPGSSPFSSTGSSQAGSGAGAAQSAAAWEALVVVDPSLNVEPDANSPCPVNEPERVFHLDLAENLIGRRSKKKDINPEVVLNDPGASHRHAKLLRPPDGGLALLDLGSTNGTQLNGSEVEAGVRISLEDGDQITLGCWTRITVRRRS